MSIDVISFQWKKNMLITGHYEFEIVITENEQNKQTIFRRFSDIEWLYEVLIKENPGCCIPNLPEKSIWYNLSINNNQELEHRKLSIKSFLDYIYKHKYLSKNQNFQNFISPSFHPSIKGESKGIVGKMYSGVSSYIPSFWSASTKTVNSQKEYEIIISKNESLIKQGEYFQTLSSSVNEMMNNIKQHIEIHKKRNNALHDFCKFTSEMNYNGLDYEKSIKPDNSIEQEYKKEERIPELNTSIQLLKLINEKNMEYVSEVEDESLKDITEYKGRVDLLNGCFERKKKHEEELAEMCAKKEGDIETKTEFVFQLNEQLKDEIRIFKEEHEGKIITIMKEFYKKKYCKNEEINKSFSNEEN